MANYVTVYSSKWVGTDGDDTHSGRDSEFIDSTQTWRTTIYSALRGLGGNDTLSHNESLDSVTLDGGAGNDSIYNGEYNHNSNNPVIDGGDGDDIIRSYGNNPIITAGNGNDSIDSTGDNATITGDNGNDSISNSGDDATITGGEDNDTIWNIGDNATLEGNTGDDSITAYGSNITIHGGAGDDSLYGSGNTDSSISPIILLDDTIGNNYFGISYSKNSSVLGGDGDNTVHSDSSNENLLISVGAGNNSIVSRDDTNVTIQAQGGNDTISINDGTKLSIDAGDGDNSISSYYNTSNSINADVTITTGAGLDTVETYGKQFLIITGAGNDSIKHVGANSTIQGGDGDDWINNHDNGRDYGTNPTVGANNLVEGGAGNDTLENSCDSVTLDGGAGDDYLSSGAVDGALLLGGDGNDTISNVANINRELATNTTISGGAGDDSIYNIGNQVTITAGEGNDTIWLVSGYRNNSRYNIQDSGSENVLINYTAGDDDDLIQFFNETSTLSIGGGEYSSVFSGDDVILTVGDGKISLQGAATLDALNIVGTYAQPSSVGISLNNTVSNTHLIGTAYDDSISNTGGSVTITALDGNNYIYNTGNDALDTINDGSKVLIVTGAGNDTIRNNYGDSVTIASSNGDNWIINENSHYTSITTGAGMDTIGFNNGSYITVDSGKGNDTISSIIYNSLVNAGAGNDSIYYQGQDTTINAGAGNDTISHGTNNGYNMYIDGGDGNDLIEGLAEGTLLGGAGNDTITINGFNDVITGGKGNDVFAYNNGRDVTITDYEKKDKIALAESLSLAGYEFNGDDLILNFDESNNLTIEDGKGKAININSTVNYYTSDGIIDKKKKSIMLLASTENFTADSKLMTIDGSAAEKVISITGNNKKNLIYAGANGSTIAGGKGKDSLVGGNGADVFVYKKGDGKDVIENFSDGDLISLTGAEIKDAKIKSGNAFIKISSGALTVKDTTEFTFMQDGAEKKFSAGVFVEEDTAKVYGSFSGTITLSDYDVKIFDGSEAKKKLTITGDDSANSITGGRGKDSLIGGAGNDTLWGGAGNDTLIGGAGDDTFIFRAGDGKDVIADYSAGDMLQIMNKRGTGYADFKKATFKGGNLTLNITGGGQVIFSGIDSSTSVNINGTNQTVSDLVNAQ